MTRLARVAKRRKREEKAKWKESFIVKYDWFILAFSVILGNKSLWTEFDENLETGLMTECADALLVEVPGSSFETGFGRRSWGKTAGTFQYHFSTSKINIHSLQSPRFLQPLFHLLLETAKYMDIVKVISTQIR